MSTHQITRRAVKAGSWYEGDRIRLDRQLTNWLHQAGLSDFGPAKAIIVPHAGYEYCGKVGAHAYKEIDPQVSRIFILGPSHYTALRKMALSQADQYETPLGNLIIDKKIRQELLDTNEFETMTMDVDEGEHSLELTLPYVFKIMQGRTEPFTIVPIMVGHPKNDQIVKYGQILAPYLADPGTCFVISSDFCHWGKRFRYTYYNKSWGDIYQSIEKLDKLGMKAIKDLRLDSFMSYLNEFGNTICGRYPIAILLATIEQLHKQNAENLSGSKFLIKFLNYDQSSHCKDMNDSSVSYVAGSVKEFTSSSHLLPVEDIVDV